MVCVRVGGVCVRVGGVCVRGMSFSRANCGKLYHKVPKNHLSNTEES